jgi:putative transcriptional regulator
MTRGLGRQLPASPAFIEDSIVDLLSNKIRELRFKNGEMTQKALAERVGISRQTMNAIENCRHAPTVVVAIKMADFFHVSVDQLFDLDYDGKPARREQPARVAVDRSPATAVESIEVESSPKPIEMEADRQVSLADLRGLIGS